jgi:primosomal protein N'
MFTDRRSAAKCKYCERRMSALDFKCRTCDRVVWRPLQAAIAAAAGTIFLITLFGLMIVLAEI